MAEEQKKKLTFSFRKSPDYKLYPATGAWGGPTGDGHILMNVMVEHGAFPSYQSHPVDNEGRVNTNEVVDSVASGDVERVILCGIMFSPRTARNVANWLLRHAEEIDGGKNA